MRKILPLLCLFLCRIAVGQNLSAVPKEHATFAQQTKALDEEFERDQDSIRAHCHNGNCKSGHPRTLVIFPTADSRYIEFWWRRYFSKLKNFPDRINYDPNGALELLEKLAKCDSNYDGYRVYFAEYPHTNASDSGGNLVPTGKWGQPTLLFVPTKKVGTIHQDDTDMIMDIKGDKVVPVPKPIASMWIKLARKEYWQNFQNQGKNKKHPNFMETESLWYAMAGAVADGDHPALLDILKCRLDCKRVTRVSARFAAFESWHQTYPRQLTLIFTISNRKKTYNITLYSGDSQTKAMSGGSDTGIPCPPPPGNCDGSLLP
jgi:hypothetical protein